MIYSPGFGEGGLWWCWWYCRRRHTHIIVSRNCRIYIYKEKNIPGGSSPPLSPSDPAVDSAIQPKKHYLNKKGTNLGLETQMRLEPLFIVVVIFPFPNLTRSLYIRT
jgi:hypothetical protein